MDEADYLAYTNPIRLVFDDSAPPLQPTHDQAENPQTSAARDRASPRLTELMIAVCIILFAGIAALWFVIRKPGHQHRPSVPVKPPSETESRVSTRISEEPPADQDWYRYRSILLSSSIEANGALKEMRLGTAQSTINIAFSDVVACEIHVNRVAVARISNDAAGLGEFDLEEAFQQLMVLRQKTRKSDGETVIDLAIFYEQTNERAEHIVNFYYRAGNNRVTRDSFEDSAREALGWLRYLSDELFGEDTAAPDRAEEAAPQPDAKSADHASEDASVSITSELEKLAALAERGLLTDEEFQKAKAKLLGR